MIQTIGLGNVTGKFKASNPRYKIVFLYTTTITPCDAISDKMYLSLAKFDSILADKRANALAMMKVLSVN